MTLNGRIGTNKGFLYSKSENKLKTQNRSYYEKIVPLDTIQIKPHVLILVHAVLFVLQSYTTGI